MRIFNHLVALFGVVGVVFGQTLAPSPTESVGCEPHGDHWHCDGPRETSTTVLANSSPSASSALLSTTSEDHDHEHEHTDEPGTATLAPSPTESVGCEAHGDHWHCDGPAVTSSTSLAATLITTTADAATVGTVSVASSSSSVFTAAAAGFTRGVEAYGLAGLAAVIAIAI